MKWLSAAEERRASLSEEDHRLAKIIGQNIYMYRKRAGWSIRTLAERSGNDAAWISRLERGKTRRPSHKTVTSIAHVLGVPVELMEKPSPGRDQFDRAEQVLAGAPEVVECLAELGELGNSERQRIEKVLVQELKFLAVLRDGDGSEPRTPAEHLTATR